MQRETSNDSFLEYGQTYHEPIRLTHPDLIHQHQTAITRRYVSQFYCFSCDTYIEVHDGIGVLLVSHTANTADVQEFAMNRLIHIKPNVYFAVVKNQMLVLRHLKNVQKKRAPLKVELQQRLYYLAPLGLL